MTTQRWNHNTHHHRRILAAAPAGARTALDVGCGEGLLVRRLTRVVDHVTGLDHDPVSTRSARARAADLPVEHVLGDLRAHPFTPASFDLVTAVASLHHLDATEGLVRLRELVRPGGVLVIVGCATSTGLTDVPFEVAGVLTHRVLSARRAVWEDGAPTVWPPPETYTTMRRLTAQVLPGRRYRRHALWRYSVVWTAP